MGKAQVDFIKVEKRKERSFLVIVKATPLADTPTGSE